MTMTKKKEMTVEEAMEMVEAAMESNKNKKMNDVDIEHAGEKIVLPAKPQEMSIKTAIKHLERKQEAEETDTAVHHEIKCSPLDGFVAFQRALSHKYGWIDQIPTPGFFGPTPPALISVPVSLNEVVQVPYGRLQVPGVEGYLETGMDLRDPKFIIGGVVKKKHAYVVTEIAELTNHFLKQASIYKGKAVRINFNYVREGRKYDPMRDCPKFFDVNGVSEDGLIFGSEVNHSLDIGLFTPIEYSDACRQHGIPLKRGILLYGPYGTGKSMTAAVTAIKAVRSGWTFVYLENVMDLKQALAFAAQYAPCVVFSEDIDRAITGDRSVEMDEVLNIMDGIDTKGSDIITVFTTNHVDDINPAMLRPGRLDVLIEVTPPDAEAAQKLVRLYARGLLEKSADLKLIGERLAGKIPAVIREVTERGKIAAISRIKGADIAGKVKEADLVSAADAMENHTKMLQPKEDKDASHTVLIAVPNGYEGGDTVSVDFNDLQHVKKAVNAYKKTKVA